MQPAGTTPMRGRKLKRISLCVDFLMGVPQEYDVPGHYNVTHITCFTHSRVIIRLFIKCRSYDASNELGKLSRIGARSRVFTVKIQVEVFWVLTPCSDVVGY